MSAEIWIVTAGRVQASKRAEMVKSKCGSHDEKKVVMKNIG
jgi:hypothetical protein